MVISPAFYLKSEEKSILNRKNVRLSVGRISGFKSEECEAFGRKNVSGFDPKAVDLSRIYEGLFWLLFF